MYKNASDKWKLSELKFPKPNLRVYEDIFNDAIQRVQEAKDGDEVLQVIFEVDELTRRADDLVRLTFIHTTMDSTDPFYREQERWLAENMIYYDQAVLNFGEEVYNSPFRPFIEEKLGSAYFIGGDIQRKTLSDDCVEPYQRDSELSNEYYELMGSANAQVLGESKNISDLKVMFGHNDRKARKEAFKCLSQLLKERDSRLREIWDELIKLRTEIAHNLGYENFIPVGYLLNQHIHYTPEDVEIFRNQVVEEVVPLCQKLYDAQQARLGLDDLNVYDEKAVFPGGNAHRIGTDEDLIEKARHMYHHMSQETGEFIDYMLDHELFEYKDRPGKVPGGYNMILLEKKAPFVFTHFDGTINDIQVITGDLGEAFARYVAARTQPVKEYYSASAEIMEIYALSMSQFAYGYAEDFFGDEADKYRYSNMQEILTMIPAACAIDEFQHICYANPSLTPEERNQEWRRLEKKYLPWRKYDGDEFMESGTYWYSISNIFVYPFYFIDYALARVHALEMKKKYDANPQVTWQEFMGLMAQGGRLGYKEFVEKANLTPLFQEGAVAKAISYAKEIMESYLLTLK